MPEPLTMTIAIRKIDGVFEAAVVNKGAFMRALTGKDLYKMIMPQLLLVLTSDRPDDTEIGIVVNVLLPEAKVNDDQRKDSE
jgi:hypothetical protein